MCLNDTLDLRSFAGICRRDPGDDGEPGKEDNLLQIFSGCEKLMYLILNMYVLIYIYIYML